MNHPISPRPKIDFSGLKSPSAAAWRAEAVADRWKK